MARVQAEYGAALVELRRLQTVKRRDLVLLAPRDGVVSGAPRADDIGKFYEKDPTRPFCTVTEPGRLRVCLPVATHELNQLRENLVRPSPAARRTRALLARKVTVAFDKTPLTAALTELERLLPGVALRLDPGAGVSPVEAVTYRTPKPQAAALVLDAMFEGKGLGFIVVSHQGDPRDGWVLVRPGRERGEPEGGAAPAELPVTVRVHGRGIDTWKGKLDRLPESEAREVPPALASRFGGPVPVKGTSPSDALVPQVQQYLVYVDITEPDAALAPGATAQVKIHCQPETCARWLWRTINNTFDLGLL
jgi:hypothetical protein